MIDHPTDPRAAARRPLYRVTPIAAAAVLAFGLAGQASAFEVAHEHSPDLTVRFDNTLRMNYAQRVEERDSKIGNSVLADEGTYSFDKGDSVAKRVDLLTELDIVYMKRHGARLSTAAWYDGAYDSNSHSNPALAPAASYVGNKYSSTTKRFYRGGSGEILDAFIFGGVDLGDVPVQGKLGRHTVYWGESLYLGGHMHSIAYAQNPLDLQKGFATPGTEAKELFRPLSQLSLQAQITETFSVAAQYLLEWEAARYPEGGTYLGPVDFVFNGPDRQLLAPGVFATRGNAVEPHQQGEWGVSARWSPEWLDGTVGLYYRNFADKLPQVLRTAPTRYNLIYADNIELFGISLAKSIAGVSVGVEFSQRRNTPLNSAPLGLAVGIPEAGETKGPRGDTYHALINALGVIPQTFLFDTATWGMELTFSRLDKVRSGENLFNGLGYAFCNGKDMWDGCATKNYAGIGLSFAPSWFQALPGVDLSLPLTYAIGLKGNAATTFGGNEDLGNYSVGLGADVQQKYRFDLKYIDFVGRYKDNGTAVTSTNGLNTYLKDRGFVSLTFKTTF